jgi:hypothetical protein
LFCGLDKKGDAMKNWVEITISLDHERKQETVRAEIPDLDDYHGKMSVYGVLEPRLWGLSERVARLLAARGPKSPRYGPNGTDDDGEVEGRLEAVRGGE